MDIYFITQNLVICLQSENILLYSRKSDIGYNLKRIYNIVDSSLVLSFGEHHASHEKYVAQATGKHVQYHYF